MLSGSLQAFDAVIAERLQLAVARGELASKADPAALAPVASCTLSQPASHPRSWKRSARAGVALATKEAVPPRAWTLGNDVQLAP